MKTRTEKILTFLKVVAYIAMIGFIIETSSELISYAVSFVDTESAKGISGTSRELYPLREQNVLLYSYVISFVVALSAMHAYVWYQVIQMLSSLNLSNPFSWEVAHILEKLSIQLFGIFIVSVIAEQSVKGISKTTGLDISSPDAMVDYLFMSGIVYIISQVFKRGIEIQEENELTV